VKSNTKVDILQIAALQRARIEGLQDQVNKLKEKETKKQEEIL